VSPQAPGESDVVDGLTDWSGMRRTAVCRLPVLVVVSLFVGICDTKAQWRRTGLKSQVGAMQCDDTHTRRRS
jgi:hypothetical protein